MAQQLPPGFNPNDSLMDSEDLMSWLLLNPEVDFDNLTTALSGVVADTVAQTQMTSAAVSLGNTAPVAAIPVIPLVTQPVEYFKAFGPDTSSENLAALDNTLKRSYSNYSLHAYHSGNNLNGLMDTNVYGRKSNDNISQGFSSSGSAPSRGFGSASESTMTGFGVQGFVKSSSNGHLNTLSSGASVAGSKKVASKSSASAKKRPRESLEDLEARVKELKAENADLHAHLLNVTQRTTEVQKQRVSMERLMAQKLAELENGQGNDLNHAELAQTVKQYTDIYADYGRCRQREVSFHLQQLEKLIVPTLTTKMCLWTLQQDKAFYQRNKSPMYDLLCKELEITPEQTEKIQERRERIKYLLGQLKESLDLLQSLKDATEKKHASYDHVCGRVQDASQPRQTVKFLMWITKNADTLAKYIPGFGVRASYIPNVEFVEEVSNENNRSR